MTHLRSRAASEARPGARSHISSSVNESTTRRYPDLLTDALMIRQLQPWHANLRKRQVRSPRLFVRDSGLLHPRLGIESEKALASPDGLFGA